MCRGEAKPGLGDHTERLLASVGITPERYKEAKRLFGLAPKCGCSGRKQKLNAADARMREWLNRVSAWWG